MRNEAKNAMSNDKALAVFASNYRNEPRGTNCFLAQAICTDQTLLAYWQRAGVAERQYAQVVCQCDTQQSLCLFAVSATQTDKHAANGDDGRHAVVLRETPGCEQRAFVYAA